MAAPIARLAVAIFLVAGITATPLQLYHNVATYGTQPVESVDLASAIAWTVAVDGGARRPIIVPGGGYNSDLQPKPWIDGHTVQDNVTYSRVVTLSSPVISRLLGTTEAGDGGDGGVYLEFGGVAHAAEVYAAVGNRTNSAPPMLLGRHYGAMMPFSVDLSPLGPQLRTALATDPAAGSTAGSEIMLTVVAFPPRAVPWTPAGFIYPEAWKYNETTKQPQWASKNAFGITKFVRLALYSSVVVTDVVVYTSVARDTVGFAVTIANYGTTALDLVLTGKFAAWDPPGLTTATVLAYPAVPPTQLTLAPGEIQTVTKEGLRWGLGDASYWWPNKPFREDYTAELHTLAVTVGPGFTATATATRRFGFVEWTEAVNNDTWYVVNGRRINFISDATPEAAMSSYDCYTTSPAFASLEGAKETWRRYMRLGISANRIHQSTPTQVMLDAADEVGFALQPETAIRAVCPVSNGYDLPVGFTQSVRELARECRGHPSVFSYSVMNECDTHSVPALLDNISSVDPSVPYVWNDNELYAPAKTFGRQNKEAHAYAMLHYRNLNCSSEHNFEGGICQRQLLLTGLGESAWSYRNDPNTCNMESFAGVAVESRQFDISYIAGWDLLNYWPNFLQGMSYAKHSWKQTGCVSYDRVDGLTGWNSSLVDWMQKAFHPHAVYDVLAYASNPKWINASLGSNHQPWPAVSSTTAPAGAKVTREIVIYNDVVATPATNLTFRWSGPLSLIHI